MLTAVDALTHREGETYDEFVRRAGETPVARRVKIADIEDNLDLTRIAQPTEKDHARLERYRRALAQLTGGREGSDGTCERERGGKGEREQADRVAPLGARGVRLLVGIDGCKDGRWVVATSGPDLESLQFDVVEDLTPLRDVAARAGCFVAIDIPIGLPGEQTRGADGAARAAIGPRASSVFPAPSRSALDAADYGDACQRNLPACGKSMSRQAYEILARIRQVDRLVEPALQAYFREAHPEVTFRMLADAPLQHAKKTPAGENERLALLAGIGVRFEPEAERQRLGRGRVGRDDLIDAAACLVTAYRISRGIAVSLPEGRVERDERGLRMEIVA